MGWKASGLIVAVLAALQQVPPPRDAAKPAAGTATVRGRVIAAATGQPLHRVRVTLNASLPNAPYGVTDTRGEFELTNVPAGTYTLTATRAGYLTLQYGQRRPREAGRTIAVKAGEIVNDVEMPMFRAGVLAGRILDELGEPAAARVEAIELRYIRGRRVPVAARIASTNDLGEYRLSGLEPGSYQIRATSTQLWESDDGTATLAYAPTVFPGVAGADQAQSITVAVGQEVAGVDFRLIAGRAARITGVVEDANGTGLANQVVNLDVITRTTGGNLLSAGFGGTTRTDARGAFELAGLPPGEYVVYSGAQTERVAVPVMLQESDLKHVALTPRAPAAIAGVVTTDEKTAPPLPPARIRINPVSADPASVLPVWAAPTEQSPRADWTFRIPNAEGPFLFRVNGLPDEWMLKGVMLGGRDITDVPLNVVRGAGDTQGVQIVLTRKGAMLAGEVVDTRGAAAPDCTVIVFAENRSLWGLASRFIRSVRPDKTGRFSLAALPPGVYRVVASDTVMEGQWEDPEFLELVMPRAVRIELAESSSENIKVTLGEVR